MNGSGCFEPFDGHWGSEVRTWMANRSVLCRLGKNMCRHSAVLEASCGDGQDFCFTNPQLCFVFLYLKPARSNASKKCHRAWLTKQQLASLRAIIWCRNWVISRASCYGSLRRVKMIAEPIRYVHLFFCIARSWSNQDIEVTGTRKETPTNSYKFCQI